MPEVLVDIVNRHSFVVDTWSSAAASPPTRASSSSRSSPQTANAPHLARHRRACLLHPWHRPHFGVAEGEDCGADGACEEEEGHEEVSEQEQVKKRERENILSVGREVRWKAQRGMEVVKVSAPVLSESFESVRSWCAFSSVVWLQTLMASAKQQISGGLSILVWAFPLCLTRPNKT